MSDRLTSAVLRFAISVVLSSTVAGAQSALTEHTVRLDDPASRAAAEIADAAWLAGRWGAEALGGTAEEHWAAPSGGAMVGMFRLTTDGEASFYELFALAEEEGSLVLRLKHFHADMRGWEDQDQTVDFPLVSRTATELKFDGLTYRREGPDAIAVYLAMRQKDGNTHEVTFRFARLP